MSRYNDEEEEEDDSEYEFKPTPLHPPSYFREFNRQWEERQKSLTTDASPFAALLKTLTTLRSKWLRIFNGEAEEIAEKFTNANSRDTQADLKRRLKEAGFAVRFKPDQETQRYMKMAVEENVSLIRSIPEAYHTQVRKLVTQAAMNGGDVGGLKKQLQERFHMTERRAAFIANDQTHKISAGIERQKCVALGMNKARWKHAGRHPHPEHVKASRDRLVYDIRKGALIGDKHIWPSSEPNCHCRAEYIIPGYNDSLSSRQPIANDNAGNPDQPRDEKGRFVAVGSERFYHEYAKKRAQELDPSDRGGILTKAGRAFQKHGGRSGSVFPPPKGNPHTLNAEGQRILEEILDDPDLMVFFRGNHHNYGKSFHIFAENGKGKGAAFYHEHHMIGLREPLSVEGLEKHLKEHLYGRKK